MKSLSIIWQRLVDSHGKTCDRCDATHQEMRRALSRLKEALHPLGIEPTLEVREIDEAAFKVNPSESNRIWIAGRPVEEWLGARVGSSRCCSVCGESECRTVEVGEARFEAIPAELVIKAALIASSQLLDLATEAPTAPQSLERKELRMKRFHVHVAVDDLAANIRFYSTVFGAQPSVVKDDYAKWMLDDPRVNFAISSRGAKPGIDHLGLQVDSDEELVTLRAQVGKAEIAAFDQSQASCCYAKSDKYWINDPQGIAWETFHTLDQIPVFGADTKVKGGEAAGCCAPAKQAVRFVERAKSGACC